MQITNNNYSPAYKAKFFHTEDLKKVVEYAHQTNCFDKINKARKRIDNAYLTRRLKFEFGKGAEGYLYQSFHKLRYTIIPSHY